MRLKALLVPTSQSSVIGSASTGPQALKIPTGDYAQPRVSPDGAVLAVARRDAEGSDIFTYDLSGNGKTVLKANYGLYWHNPGVTVPGNGNPNTAAKQATYTWNDINGDKRWQPGEEGLQTSAALEGAVGVDLRTGVGGPPHSGSRQASSERGTGGRRLMTQSHASLKRWQCFEINA